MDWLEAAKAWGPAVPVFMVFCYLLRELIHVELPKGFKQLTENLQRVRHQHAIERRSNAKKFSAIEEVLQEILIELRTLNKFFVKDQQDREG